MTLFFQVQFLKLKYNENAKSTIRNALKIERKKKVPSLKKISLKARKKIKELKRDIIEIYSHKDSIGKGNIRKILNSKTNMKKRNIRQILIQKNNMEKRNTGKIQNKRENIKKATNIIDKPKRKRKYENNKYDENPEPIYIYIY